MLGCPCGEWVEADDPDAVSDAVDTAFAQGVIDPQGVAFIVAAVEEPAHFVETQLFGGAEGAEHFGDQVLYSLVIYRRSGVRVAVFGAFGVAPKGVDGGEDLADIVVFDQFG